MTWNTQFVTELARNRYAARYILRKVPIPAHESRPFGGILDLSSFTAQGRFRPILSVHDSSFSGGVLSVRDWSCTPLSFSVGIMGNAIGSRDLRKVIQRGQGVVLEVGFTDDPADFVPVAIGTVVGLSRSSSGWSLRCKGLEGSLSSRIVQGSTKTSIGWDLATATSTGSIAQSDTTITVGAGEANGFRTDGQGLGVVQITANDGSLYYATYTGTSGGNTFTGVTIGSGGSPIFGTSHSTTTLAGGGGAVTEVMYTSAHPCKVIERILTSTGTGTNGDADILPESWGFGIPAEHVDSRDINFYANLLKPSGTGAWHWVQPAELETPQAAMNQWMNDAGFFLTQHRGSLTCRGVPTIWEDNTPGNLTITDAMIVPNSIRYETWNPDTPIEYARTRILYADETTASTSAASEIDHGPGHDLIAHTLGGVWGDSSNATAIANEIGGRLKYYDQRTAEILSFDLIGWWPGAASIGDTVNLEIGFMASRLGESYRGRKGLVLRCAPDWFGSATQVEIAVLPEDDNMPWRVQPV